MNILDQIVAQKRTEVALLPSTTVTVTGLRDLLEKRGRRDFVAALKKPRIGSIGLIAEVKKASPSAGVICPDFDAVRIAKDYEAAGASCLSVLTDVKFFQGSLEYLKQIRAAVNLPLLRKDFMVDERQIAEAIEWGADAILLIVACLSDTDLRRFHELATEAGLAALVEVHDEQELERALTVNAKLVGVNNRNLKDLTINLATTERLATRLFAHSPDALLVAESGLKTRAGVERVQRSGAKAILVGESLMKDAANIRKNIAALVS
jgi:indole-3-glycerol phosphate synthase